jgi:hypothetical protein
MVQITIPPFFVTIVHDLRDRLWERHIQQPILSLIGRRMTRIIVTRRGELFEVRGEGARAKPQGYILSPTTRRFYELVGSSHQGRLVTGTLASVLRNAMNLKNEQTAKYTVKVEGNAIHVQCEEVQEPRGGFEPP